MNHTCPVCGFVDLYDSPRTSSGGGSYEICPSCGFQFGVSDDDRGITYEEWRQKWIVNGMQWKGFEMKQPSDWNPEQQLLNIIKSSSF